MFRKLLSDRTPSLTPVRPPPEDAKLLRFQGINVCLPPFSVVVNVFFIFYDAPCMREETPGWGVDDAPLSPFSQIVDSALSCIVAVVFLSAEIPIFPPASDPYYFVPDAWQFH